MRYFWYGGGLLLILLLVAIVFSMVATVNRDDVVYNLQRYDAREMSGVQPGQMYKIYENNTFSHSPVCFLKKGNLEIEKVPGGTREFYNTVGRWLPFLVELRKKFFGTNKKQESPDKDDGLKGDGLYRLVLNLEEEYIPDSSPINISETCRDDVTNMVENDGYICTVSSVLYVVDGARKRPLAVGFRRKCLNLLSCGGDEVPGQRSAKCPPEKFAPTLREPPLPTLIKANVGVIQSQ